MATVPARVALTATVSAAMKATTLGAGTVPLSGEASARPSHAPSPAKQPAAGRQAIIIVPSAITCLITMWNAVELLEERMRSELIDAAERDVFVRSDGDIRVRELVTVMDRLKAGGVANVGLVTEFPSDR